MGSNTEKKPWTNLQAHTKIEAKRLRATTFAIAKLEESNIFAIFKGKQKLFRILIIFSPTVEGQTKIQMFKIFKKITLQMKKNLFARRLAVNGGNAGVKLLTICTSAK